MDTATKEQFKWKFYSLTILLNLIVLLVAIGVIAFFKAPTEYQIPFSLILLLAAIMVGIVFWGRYRETRKWLEDQG
jgi:membrane protein YdbS with pleckstrin-like domain